MSEIHGAVGSYVVNALDPDDLAEFEAHLAVCPTCSNEVVEFCETAAQLALLAPEVGSPPPSVRSGVLAAIAQVRPLPPEVEHVDPAAHAAAGPSAVSTPTTDPHRLTIVAGGPGASVAPTPAPVDELALRRASRRARVLSLAVAAALVVALSLGGWAFSLNRSQQSQVAGSALESQLLTAPDVRMVPVTTRNGAKVSFVWSKALNKAIIISNDLPPTGDDYRYQLWTIKTTAAGTESRPDALMPGGTRHEWFTGPIDDSTALAVTIEPKTGSAGPSTPIQAAATF